MTKIVSRALSRFSTLSLCCVGVLIASGILNSWILVGSIHALFTTDYGRLLLFKLALFGVLIGLGAQNRLTIKASSATTSIPPGFLQRIRGNIIGEICLGAAVVLIVACLGVTAPAQHPQP